MEKHPTKKRAMIRLNHRCFIIFTSTLNIQPFTEGNNSASYSLAIAVNFSEKLIAKYQKPDYPPNPG
jgi:hypothetical protein